METIPLLAQRNILFAEIFYSPKYFIRPCANERYLLEDFKKHDVRIAFGSDFPWGIEDKKSKFN